MGDNKLGRWVTTWAALAVACANLAPRVGAGQDMTPAMKQLADEAQKEGTVSTVWSVSTLGGARGISLYEAGMNRMFGTAIHIEFTPGPSMPAVGNDIAMRDAAGQPSQTDVWMGFSRDVSNLIGKNIFLSADWHALLPNRIDANIAEADGRVVKVTSGLLGVTYNTQLMPMKPERLTDFLDQRLKGKIATTPYSASFDILAGPGLYGPEKALDYARQLSDQIGGLTRCDQDEGLASGEFVAQVLDCGGTDVFRLAEKGAPIAHFTARDFPVVSYFYLAVPRRAPHPAAGKLFVAFLSTAEGQAIIWDTWHADLHVYPGSHTSRQVEEIERAYGEKLVDVNIAWQLANAKGQETWDQINKILAVRK
jgi:ABC-type Fe3+ transport system substrate-binding protein